MAPVPTFVDVYFRDDASRVTKVRYRLLTSAEDDGTNMAAVITAADALETALNTLTEDHIDFYEIIVRNGGGGAAALDTANNQVVAFVRTVLATSGDTSHFIVPAWTNALYERDRNNLMNAAFLTDAQIVADLTVDPDTGEAWDVSSALSKGRTGRKRQIG